MPEITGTKWGASRLGSDGGVVTYSLIGGDVAGSPRQSFGQQPLYQRQMLGSQIAQGAQRATVIETGSVRCPFATARMRCGMVAVKRAVWRSSRRLSPPRPH